MRHFLALGMMLASSTAHGELSESNPYYSIVEANVFRLQSEPEAPPPTTEEEEDIPEADPEEIDLTLTGFGNFGGKEVIYLMTTDKKDPKRKQYISAPVSEDRTSPVNILSYDPTKEAVTLVFAGRKMSLNMEEHGNKPSSGGTRRSSTSRTASNAAKGNDDAEPAAARGPVVFGRSGERSETATPSGGDAAARASQNALNQNARSAAAAASSGSIPTRRVRSAGRTVVGSRESRFESAEARAASQIIEVERVQQETGVKIPMPPGLDINSGPTGAGGEQ